MQISVSLQSPYSYSIYPIIIIGILVVISSLILYFYKIKEKETPKTPEEIKQFVPKNLNTLKSKYIKKINILEEKLLTNKINIRTAYQGLSSIIRYFVYEVTNIKVHNYTLKDIERLNMPVLSELIQEYYAPEFAERSLGNIKASLEKTRKVIEKWN